MKLSIGLTLGTLTANWENVARRQIVFSETLQAAELLAPTVQIEIKTTSHISRHASWHDLGYVLDFKCGLLREALGIRNYSLNQLDHSSLAMPANTC